MGYETYGANGYAVISTDPTAATPTWSAPAVIDTTGGDDPELSGVSCVSTSFCVAVDEDGNVMITTDPTATTPAWSTQAGIHSTGGLSAVSCASTALCVAVGDAGNGEQGSAVITTDPTAATPTWSTPTDFDGVVYPTGVSCASTALCVAVGEGGSGAQGGAVITTDPTAATPTWSTQGDIDGASGLTGVSCATTSLCVAVDGVGNAFVGPNSSNPSADPTSTGVGCSPSSVEAGSPSTCTATVTDTAATGASAPSGTVSFTSSPTTGAFASSTICALAPTSTPNTASCQLTFTPSSAGSYTVTGSYSGDLTHTSSSGQSGSVTATPPITQGPPTSATVVGGAGYSGQLTVTNAAGAVSYTESTSADSADVVVSSTGAISAPSTLAPGTYSVGGTDSDTTGDTGTWSFTLTLTQPATETVCIPDFPAGYLITSYTTQAGCGPGQSGWWGYNAANVALPRNGLVICETGNGQPAPAGYVFTDVFSVGSLYGTFNGGPCGDASGLVVSFDNYVSGYEEMQINQPTDGTIMCLPSGYGSPPDGYVITGVYAEGGYLSLGMCGIVFGNINYNAFQIKHPSDGLTICEPFVGISIPPGYVQTAQFSTAQCGPPNILWGFNAVQIAVAPQTSTPGVTTTSMIASGSGALRVRR